MPPELNVLISKTNLKLKGTKKKGYKPLDRDKDGEPCECLSGGSKYKESVCEWFRKKYGY